MRVNFERSAPIRVSCWFLEVANLAQPLKWPADDLSNAFHNRAQDSVDPGRVSLAIFHEPVADLLVGEGGRIQDRTDFCDLFTGLVKIDSGAHACLLRGPR